MKAYRCAEIVQLAHELTLSPLRHLPRQLNGMRRLLDFIEPGREYPYSLVCFHITSFRSRRPQDTLLDGTDLIPDLIDLLDDRSAAHPLPAEAADGRLYDADALAARFRVSTKTISRWRRRGLAGCWYASEGDKPRLAFAARDVERFIIRHQDLVRRGTSFQLMSRDEKSHIIARARELVATEKTCLHAITLRLAEETGRAIETIRYTLRRYDQEHPDEAMFDDAERPHEIDERTVIYQAFQAGDTIQALAQRFGKRDAEIRRILTAVRAAELAATPIDYVYNDLFDAPSAEQQIVEDDPELEKSDDESEDDPDVTLTRPPAELPAYLQALYRTPLLTPRQETALFRRMNFLRHQAETLRQRLPADPAMAKGMDIAAIDDLLEQAVEVKNRIIQANLRLVVSIARRHLRAAGGATLFELVSDGNIALIRAVEKFDYARGFRFSTYGSWAVKRNFAHTIPDEFTHGSRFQTGHEEFLAAHRDQRAPEAEAVEPAVSAAARAALVRSLRLLDERERRIVECHFGLSGDGPARSLDEIGRTLGISKERVRQIEIRAFGKLRNSLSADLPAALAG